MIGTEYQSWRAGRPTVQTFRTSCLAGKSDVSVRELWGWVMGHAEDTRDEALGQVADAATGSRTD